MSRVVLIFIISGPKNVHFTPQMEVKTNNCSATRNFYMGNKMNIFHQAIQVIQESIHSLASSYEEAKNWSAGQLGNVPSNGIGENRKGLCQVNTAGGVELPTEAFPGSFISFASFVT